MVLVVKNPLANARDIRDAGSILGQEDLLKKASQHTPIFLPGESHGQRNLASYMVLQIVGHNWSDLAHNRMYPTQEYFNT